MSISSKLHLQNISIFKDYRGTNISIKNGDSYFYKRINIPIDQTKNNFDKPIADAILIKANAYSNF
jgi:hypothetical protein